MKTIPTIPFEGFANVYEETYQDLRGNAHKRFLIGECHKDIEDIPDYYEYSCAKCKHIGVVKVKFEKYDKGTE